jgi:hypothetical protein
MVEVVLLDVVAVDARDGVPRDGITAAGDKRDGGAEDAKGQDESNCLGHERVSRWEGDVFGISRAHTCSASRGWALLG